MTSRNLESCETIDWSVGDAPLDGPGTAAAIGNFDGVHRGHVQVIMAAVEAAKTSGLLSSSYAPQPDMPLLRSFAPSLHAHTHIHPYTHTHNFTYNTHIHIWPRHTHTE